MFVSHNAHLKYNIINPGFSKNDFSKLENRAM